MSDLDPKLTFESFVVGPANRLASAAARRAADSPGTSYNPIFMYSASGLGKSHILSAVAHQAKKIHPKARISYITLEEYLAEMAGALEKGEREQFKDRYGEMNILLLDDVQFLTGQPEAQEMLLRTLDHLTSVGRQIVLASDRPPAEINGLDARLLSRFSGGLIVDIGMPEYETRVAIIRKKAEARNQSLLTGVAEMLGKYPFRNVRELGGALNKIFATQDLEDRQVTPQEIADLMGGEQAEGEGSRDAFSSFLSQLSQTVSESVEANEAPWRKAVREAVDLAEREGFSADLIKGFLDGYEPKQWKEIVAKFRADIARLREIEKELDRLGNPWPDAAEGVLKDPERLDEAEALLTSVAERQRAFPKIGPGPRLDQVKSLPGIAVKAAEQLVAVAKPEYNPLYVWAREGELARALLGASGRTFQTDKPSSRMAVTSVKDFADDLIRALGEGVAGAWRERWWTVDLLLVHGLEVLKDTERAQDEFFHLFEALKRRGARMMFAADRPPAEIEDIDDRLRSRFEGGLVLEIEADGAAVGAEAEIELVEAESPLPPSGDALWGEEAEASDVPVPVEALSGEKREPAPTMGAKAGETDVPTVESGEKEPTEAAGRRPGGWFPSSENAVLYWPHLNDLLLEELE